MAKTKHTAKRSAGGKYPRQQLAIEAARKSSDDIAVKRFTDSISSCSVSGSPKSRQYYFTAGNDVRSPIPAESEEYFGALVKQWCELRLHHKLRFDIAARSGLLAMKAGNPTLPARMLRHDLLLLGLQVSQPW